ncbi:MAG: ArdC family protein [Phycisphaerae bacterium]
MTSAAKDKAKALRASINDSLDTLAKAVDDVRASKMFTRYLDVQAKFHHYSWGNTLLIASQRPDATRVAGFKTWQKMKRQVRKGERGIMIFAPCRFKREVENGDGDTDTVEGLFFRVVHVFDVAQTDGESLPTVDVPAIDIVTDELLGKLVRVAESRSIAVAFNKIDGGTFGASKQGSIEVSNEHATGQQAKTLAHELAHESLHWDVKGPITRNIAELEAESVAYVVCTHFGLDVEVRASRYIALWGGDSKALRESLERIATTARGIIDDVESLENRKAVA